MNIIDITDYLANVAQVARKCPTTTLRHAYMRAYREFCQQSQWLRANVPGETAVPVRQYALGSDPQLDIMGIYAMQGSAPTIKPPNIQYWPIVPSDSSLWDPNLPVGIPVRYQYIAEGQFALDPIPQLVYGLLITVILAPKEGAVNAPEEPLIKWSNDIEAGALEYLQALPGMPWTDLKMSAMNGRTFRSGIANAKAEVQRSYNVGSQRARPRQFLT